MSKKPPKKPITARSRDAAAPESLSLRIVGGEFRGRKIACSPDPRTRPMKDRVREALFNLLGPAVRNMHAIDPFAGSGALAFEALSRGAPCATLIEQHAPTARQIRDNAAALGVQNRCRVLAADAFIWSRSANNWAFPGFESAPRLTFVSPPFEFFASRTADLLLLIERALADAPPESACAVEADGRFDFRTLPEPDLWDMRDYPPARLAIRWTSEPS